MSLEAYVVESLEGYAAIVTELSVAISAKILNFIRYCAFKVRLAN